MEKKEFLALMGAFSVAGIVLFLYIVNMQNKANKMRLSASAGEIIYCESYGLHGDDSGKELFDQKSLFYLSGEKYIISKKTSKKYFLGSCEVVSRPSAVVPR